MDRRRFVKTALAVPALAFGCAQMPRAVKQQPLRRVRPGDPDWPSATSWQQLEREVGGRLLRLEAPFDACTTGASAQKCLDTLAAIKNPYFIRDQAALTQTSGWLNAWRSRPSAYAVAAENAADVAAAVNFARRYNLRLVVKGGGHSYHGTSNAQDSLLIWTRPLNQVTLHDAFVGQGCNEAPQPAVSLGAGAVWSEAYSAVTTRAGRYVQGGGCTTVGVAGLVQSGGFGNFSKNFGTAAASLLEAEVVTADGRVRIANACRHPDLFWALKGGGGGSFGVITRLTLKTHALPEWFGGVFLEIKAATDAAFLELISEVLEFYRAQLCNRHWGEQISVHGNNTVRVSMVFQGLTRAAVEAIWAPLLQRIESAPQYQLQQPITILTIPAKDFWNADYHSRHHPGLLVTDDRPGASPDHVVWAGDRGEAGWFIHAYQSSWLPAALLKSLGITQLATALFEASRHWSVQLHFNKGLAGAPAQAIAATQATATNPKVLDAFALAIIAGGSGAAYPGMPGAAAEPASAKGDAASIQRAMASLERVAPRAGAYVSESDYFHANWQDAYWGENYSRLFQVKQRYDPHGLFCVHHGVGSERWSADGFAPIAS